MGQSFEDYWQECLSLAQTQRQRDIMFRLKNLYKDAWEEGVSAEAQMESEWG
jgi:hypothetical protein